MKRAGITVTPETRSWGAEGGHREVLSVQCLISGHLLIVTDKLCACVYLCVPLWCSVCQALRAKGDWQV
jgi:hypothetical protein